MQNCSGVYLDESATDNALIHCSMFNPILCSYCTAIVFVCCCVDTLCIFILFSCIFFFFFNFHVQSNFSHTVKHRSVEWSWRAEASEDCLSRLLWPSNKEKWWKRNKNREGYIHTRHKKCTRPFIMWRPICSMITLNMCQWRCTMSALSVSLFKLESDKYALFSRTLCIDGGRWCCRHCLIEQILFTIVRRALVCKIVSPPPLRFRSSWILNLFEI